MASRLRKCLRLRLYKKLICQRVIGIDVCVFGGIMRKPPGIHSGMPFREAEKIIAESIPYSSKLLLDAGPTGWLAVEVDYVDLLNRLTVRRSLSAKCLRRLHRKHLAKAVPQAKRQTKSGQGGTCRIHRASENGDARYAC